MRSFKFPRQAQPGYDLVVLRLIDPQSLADHFAVKVFLNDQLSDFLQLYGRLRLTLHISTPQDRLGLVINDRIFCDGHSE